MSALPPFSFSTATNIIFGSSLVKSLGASKPFVVIGSPARYKTVLDKLNAHALFEVHGEPSVLVAKNGVEALLANGCDSVIAIGGGSVIDVGKIIAAIATNGGEPMDYLEVIGRGKKITKASLPYIAVPTTFGTGAEVTKNGVLSSEEHRVKASIRADTMIPAIALIDPELSLSVPPAVTAATGLDAFTQNLEPFVSIFANPITDALAREGLRYGARSLKRAFDNGQDVEARQDMALCSLFGGMALANAKLGAVHGFAGVIGGWCENSPHGAVCARLLPHVIEINVKALLARDPTSPYLARYDEVARIITGRADATSADGVTWIKAICEHVNVPPLKTYGIKEEDIPTIVEKSAKSSSMKGNTLVLTIEELTEIMVAAMG